MPRYNLNTKRDIIRFIVAAHKADNRVIQPQPRNPKLKCTPPDNSLWTDYIPPLTKHWMNQSD